MTLMEFSNFIEQTHPLHLICDKKLEPLRLSAKLSEALTFNTNAKETLIEELYRSKTLENFKLTLKRKNMS